MSRAKFEKWHKGRIGYAPIMVDGQYASPVQARWEAWQAGQASRQQPEPVADEKVFVDAGHLREVLNGNAMMVYAAPEQDTQGRLAELHIAAQERPTDGDHKL
jgi:hypothetical protein